MQPSNVQTITGKWNRTSNENILNRLKEAKDPLQEGIQIASEQAHDFFNIANGVHLMAVKAEHLIPEIIEKADLNLEY